MKQVLVDLYEVEFNHPRMLSQGGPIVVIHETNPEEYIVLDPVNKTVMVGEPYLLPLQKYGGGFKSKKLVAKNCCWVGSGIASRVANKGGSVAARGRSYRMVEEDA